MKLVHLPALTGPQASSWDALLRLAPELGPGWLLIGGQMVFLHHCERGSTASRPTTDVDVVIDVKVDRAGLERVHELLTAHGFTQGGPSPQGLAHRFVRDQATIDILAPDHLGERTVLELGFGRTIGAPGSRLALSRSSWVTVHGPGPGSRLSAEIRRPTLLGAMVAKAAAVGIGGLSPWESLKHATDLGSLAELVGPEDRSEGSLSAGEKRLFRRALESAELSPLAVANLTMLLG